MTETKSGSRWSVSSTGGNPEWSEGISGDRDNDFASYKPETSPKTSPSDSGSDASGRGSPPFAGVPVDPLANIDEPKGPPPVLERSPSVSANGSQVNYSPAGSDLSSIGGSFVRSDPSYYSSNNTSSSWQGESWVNDSVNSNNIDKVVKKIIRKAHGLAYNKPSGIFGFGTKAVKGGYSFDKASEELKKVVKNIVDRVATGRSMAPKDLDSFVEKLGDVLKDNIQQQSGGNIELRTNGAKQLKTLNKKLILAAYSAKPVQKLDSTTPKVKFVNFMQDFQDALIFAKEAKGSYYKSIVDGGELGGLLKAALKKAGVLDEKTGIIYMRRYSSEYQKVVNDLVVFAKGKTSLKLKDGDLTYSFRSNKKSLSELSRVINKTRKDINLPANTNLNQLPANKDIAGMSYFIKEIQEEVALSNPKVKNPHAKFSPEIVRQLEFMLRRYNVTALNSAITNGEVARGSALANKIIKKISGALSIKNGDMSVVKQKKGWLGRRSGNIELGKHCSGSNFAESVFFAFWEIDPNLDTAAVTPQPSSVQEHNVTIDGLIESIKYKAMKIESSGVLSNEAKISAAGLQGNFSPKVKAEIKLALENLDRAYLANAISTKKVGVGSELAKSIVEQFATAVIVSIKQKSKNNIRTGDLILKNKLPDKIPVLGEYGDIVAARMILPSYKGKITFTEILNSASAAVNESASKEAVVIAHAHDGRRGAANYRRPGVVAAATTTVADAFEDLSDSGTPGPLVPRLVRAASGGTNPARPEGDGRENWARPRHRSPYNPSEYLIAADGSPPSSRVSNTSASSASSERSARSGSNSSGTLTPSGSDDSGRSGR